MDKVSIAIGAGALALVLTGCGPELAQGPTGEVEERWKQELRENYSGYEAPHNAPPAIRDNVSERLLKEEEMRRNGSAAAEKNARTGDPADVVDNAADRPAAEELPPAHQQSDAKSPSETVDKAADGKAGAEKAAAPAEKNTTYVVKSGDTLGSIAQQKYGDARRSDVILRANPELKKNPNFLKVGTKLVIPKL